MLFLLAKIIAIICATQMWIINIGIRANAYDYICFIFLIFMVLQSRNQSFKQLPKEVGYLLIFLWGFVIIEAISGIFILNSYDISASSDQYLKKCVMELFRVLFFSAFIVYINQLTSQQRYALVKYFIWGGVLSSLYGLGHMIFQVGYGINIDQYIWEPISYNATESKLDESWLVMGLPRGKGFAGVNLSGTYYLMIIPFLYSFLFLRKSEEIKKITNWPATLLIVVTVGLLVTLSRTGMATALLSIVIVTLLSKKSMVPTISFAVVTGIILAVVTTIYGDYVDALIESRATLSTDRYDIFIGGFELLEQYPFGIGTSNYSVARFILPNDMIHDENLHSSWLTTLVELGFIGFLFLLTTFIYIILVVFKARSSFRIPYLASLICLLLAGAFNQLFDTFSFYLFLVMFFVIIINDNRESKHFPTVKA